VVTLADIEAARERIRGAVLETPCLANASLSNLLGCEVYLKLENLQRTGSFKERGALNRLLALTSDERQRGVITASAGNYAQAISYHAGRLGIPVTVVMPEPSALVKVNANRGFGARVVLHGARYDDAAVEARRLQAAEDLVYVHPFDDDRILAGQGTIGLELFEQVPGLDAAFVAVGGGGLAGGIAVALKARSPGIQFIGVETRAYGTLGRSLAARDRVTVAPATTIADGIQVRTLGELTFPILRDLVDRVVEVDDEEIAHAILALLEQAKTVAEGSGAAALAGLMQIVPELPELKGKKVAVVVSGGNIDVNLLARIIERGLLKTGRWVKLRLNVADRPGALAKLTETLASERAHILGIDHDRFSDEASFEEVTVELSLETRGEPHAGEIVAALISQGYHPRRVH
jgi:threonine dehydratase